MAMNVMNGDDFFRSSSTSTFMSERQVSRLALYLLKSPKTKTRKKEKDAANATLSADLCLNA